MAALKPNHQRWIVIRLAIFDSPKAIVEDFAKEFPGIAITRQQAWEYDCSVNRNRERRSEELVELFDATREEWQAATKGVAIANKRWRLEQYERLMEEAREEGQRRLQLDILKQAAEDDGDAYTNKKDVTSGGQPVKALVCVDLDAV